MPVSPKHSDPDPLRPPNSSDLPEEMRFASDSGNRTVQGSATPAVLIGGSPLRLIALRPKLRDAFSALERGDSIREVAVATKSSVAAIRQVANRLLDAGMLHPRPPSATPTPPVNVDPTHTSSGYPDAQDAWGVTLVIPVFNRATALERLLSSLGPCRYPIVVVDDGSTDRTGEVAVKFGATVIRNEAPTGPAAARNVGLLSVTTQFVAFLDSDCVAAADWLDALMPHFHDPAVALVAARIVDLEKAAQPDGERSGNPYITPSNGSVDRAIAEYEHVRSALDLGPTEGPVVPRSRIAYVPAAALVGRTEVLTRFGGFETTMPVGEDVDLVWRLHKHGWRVRYEPRSKVQHDHRVTLRSFLHRRFDYGTSAARLHARHPGSVPPVAVSSWTAVSWVLAALGGPLGVLAGLTTAGVSTALLPKKLGMLASPTQEAARLAGRGHVAGGRLLASALWRTWLPLALMVALVSRRSRWILLASGVLPNLLDWRERSPSLDPARYVGLRMAEDAAYCAGVWRGCAAEKSVGALLPDLTSWPGKRRVREDDGGDPVSAE